MCADTRIETHAVDDVLCVETFHLRVCVEFVEIAHAKRQIGIGKQLDGFGFGQTHDTHLDLFFDRAFFQQFRKTLCRLCETFVAFDCSDDDSGRVEVVVQRFALAQKLRRKENVLAVVFVSHTLSVTHRNGRFDDHDRFRVDAEDGLYDVLHRRSVEIIPLAVIVRRGGNNDVFRILICGFGIECRCEVEFFFGEVFLNILVLDG